ncbi:MAG: V-type ATP synthase subunit I [Bacteroidaceae bacterium]|nr:V-type ATP synthase subunit I [Bacteroidaceae bacterium]
MKKLTFLVTEKEYDSFIASLRTLGVVHIQQLQKGASSQELQDGMALEQRYKAALQALEIYAKTYKGMALPDALKESASPAELLQHVEDLQAEELNLLHSIDALQKDIQMLEHWGDFDPANVKTLSEASSQQIHFYRCSSKFFKREWIDTYFATPINEINKSIYFITFSEDVPDIQAEQIFLPKGTLSGYIGESKEEKKKLDAVRAELLFINANLRDELEKGLVEVQNDISLSKVHLSDERVAGDVLRLMIGWVRADKTQDLVEYLEKDKIYYEMEDPAYEDDVPVQITNDGYTRLFEPILRMYSLPNYHDIDPSLFFAPFFMLFFGLCLGDGGYGLLVLLGGAYLAWKGSGNMKSYGRLGIWLGLATTVCGLLTGTVFGIDLTQQDWAILAPVKPYFINDNGIGPIFGYSPMMVFSVIIGFIQVLLGMVLKACKAWKNYGFGYSIGTFSWIIALLMFVVILCLPADVELPYFVRWLPTGILILSSIGIFLYNNPSAYKNPITGPLLNIGGGVWATYGMATGLLGDLLSYIRLFALGLTGGVLGGVFNSLALDLTSSMPWTIRWAPMLLILLAGHGITFALSMISAFVHPMRLTFVEFFKNADFEGGGKEYTPFQVKNGPQ